MQQGGGIHYGGEGCGRGGENPSAYKTVSHNTMLLTIKKEKKNLLDREHVVREVYGFLYNRLDHIFDDFWFEIMYKLSHIIGSSKVILNNGDIDEDQNIWILSSGRMIDMSRPRIKELLVRLLKDSFSFRLVEFVDVIPYTIENRKGVIGDLIIDRDFISRVVEQTRLTEEKETGVKTTPTVASGTT